MKTQVIVHCKCSKLLREIKEQLNNMSQQIDDFKAAVDVQFTQMGTNFDNIAADEANLAQQIKDLQAQIGTGLSAADQATLQSIVDTATAMAGRSKTIADNVPDTPGGGGGGGGPVALPVV